jgi:hypothetical protein
MKTSYDIDARHDVSPGAGDAIRPALVNRASSYTIGETARTQIFRWLYLVFSGCLAIAD